MALKRADFVVLIVLLLLAIGMLPLMAEGKKDIPKPGEIKQEILLVSDKTPEIDGNISKDEYSLQIDLSGIKVYLNLGAKTLSFGIAAEAKGWTAIGLGSTRMNKAKMFLGYIKDGNANVTEEIGSGRTHSKSGDKLLKNSALSEANGITVFEGELDATAVITKDQEVLDFIVAASEADNFTGFHKTRAGYSVKLK